MKTLEVEGQYDGPEAPEDVQFILERALWDASVTKSESLVSETGAVISSCETVNFDDIELHHLPSILDCYRHFSVALRSIAFDEKPAPGSFHARVGYAAEVRLLDHHHHRPLDVGDIAHTILEEGKLHFDGVKVEFAPSEEDPYEGILSVEAHTSDCEFREICESERTQLIDFVRFFLDQSPLVITGGEAARATVVDVPWKPPEVPDPRPTL